jgi:transmembrane sensor
MSTTEPLNAQIVDEAALWFVDFNTGEPDVEARRKFDTWLRKSPEHLRAYLDMFGLWDDAALVDPQRRLTSNELVDLARRTADVVSLEPSVAGAARAGTSPTARLDRKPRERRSAAIAVAATILLLLLGALTWAELQRGAYSTDIGEQRMLTLNDGSTIELNARSRIKVRYTPTERRIDLFAGQALFNVAKDPARPFLVQSDQTQVRAVGTQFDVYRKKTGTLVTVVEGRVAVVQGGGEIATEIAPAPVSASGGHRPIVLDAGQQLTVSAVAVSEREHPDIVAATAWTQRRLVFSSTPLEEVAEEFNRYNERQLVIADPGVRSFHVSGVFSSTDPGSLIRFLRAQPDIRVDEQEAQIRITGN